MIPPPVTVNEISRRSEPAFDDAAGDGSPAAPEASAPSVSDVLAAVPVPLRRADFPRGVAAVPASFVSSALVAPSV